MYRRILRAHRRLPEQMRFVGDQYVRAEFRSHQEITDRKYLDPFFNQWSSYLEMIQQQTHQQTRLGQDLDQTTIESLEDDRAEQLLELHKASTSKN